MSISSLGASLRSALSGPPGTVDGRSVPMYALFLTTLLVGVVPIVALTTGLPILALVGVAGLLYAATLLVTESIFAGLCAAVFVLVTFAANVPLVELPVGGGGYTTPILNVLLIDVVAVPFAGLLFWWFHSGRMSVSFDRERIAGYALAGFVGWSLLAALVANGPSRLAGLFYVVVQLRYLLVFSVASVAAKYTGIYSAVYSLGIAVVGHLAYAMAEIINRGSFGLTYLGDSGGGPAPHFYIGTLQFEASLYAGGFAGTSRVLVGLLLLFFPVFIRVVVRRSAPWKLAAGVALVCTTFLVRVARTDSGWMAFLLTALLTVVVLSVLWITTDTTDWTDRSGALDYISGVGAAISAVAFSFLLFSTRVTPSTPSDAGDSSWSSSSTGGSSSVGGDTRGGSEAIVQAINRVPFIQMANLSIRLQQYVGAIDIALQYPLFGIGGMNFPLVAESYELPEPIAIHNIYLSVLAATGVPGAVLFLLAISAVLIAAGRAALSPTNDRLFWAMIVCGMVGFCAYLFWVTAGNGVALLTFWTLAGAIIGASRRQHRTVETGRSDAT